MAFLLKVYQLDYQQPHAMIGRPAEEPFWPSPSLIHKVYVYYALKAKRRLHRANSLFPGCNCYPWPRWLLCKLSANLPDF